MTQLNNFFTLENAYFVQTLFALASFALGLTGITLGRRLVGSGNICVVIGLGVGIGLMAMLATPLAPCAPGWGLVFIGCFLASEKLSRLTSNN